MELYKRVVEQLMASCGKLWGTAGGLLASSWESGEVCGKLLGTLSYCWELPSQGGQH